MELLSTPDIDKLSFALLKDSKALDVFPTPVDSIIASSGLHLNNQTSLKQIHEAYAAHEDTVMLAKALGKVRGIYDRDSRTIYIDQSQKPVRRNFVKLHEVGHGILPWQNLPQIIEDDDDSLSDHVKEEFEAEANYFASVTLFQHDRFNHELAKYSVGIDEARKLAKHFGASIHASLIRMVQCSQKRCALLVLENITPPKSVARCDKRDLFSSGKFQETFGELQLPDQFGYTWSFVKNYYHRRKGIVAGSITLPTENGEADFDYQFFNNTYNALVLLYPVNEKLAPKKEFFLTSSDDLPF